MNTAAQIKPPIPVILSPYKAALQMSRILYLCRESSTTVEVPLQIDYFLCKTNPILKRTKSMQLSLPQRIMKINHPAGLQKTNPKQTQTNPISQKPKMNLNFYPTKDYDNEQRTINNERYSKQTQFKPNSNPTCRGGAPGEAGYGPERIGTRSLHSYTRSTAAFISRRARDQLFPSAQPHALAVATFIAVPSAELASDLSLRPFKNPANQRSF